MPVPGLSYSLLQDAVDMGYSMGTWILILVIIVFQLAAWWRVFEKAGQPGWAAIIPIYNFFVLARIAGKPMWWGVLLFIPLVNIIFFFLISVGVAKNFGKGALFGVGLMFLGFIFYPLLAFSDDQYQPGTST